MKNTLYEIYRNGNLWQIANDESLHTIAEVVNQYYDWSDISIIAC